MRRFYFGAFFAFISVWATAALAEKRVALVIGNGKYIHAGELANPVNDASDMAGELKKLGFVVIDGYDLPKAGLEKKVREFATQLQGADVGVFFYAGHGLQVSGVNYIVPVDAELTSAEALDFEMIRLDVVQRTMERTAKTNILFLDACRNNPLARNLARALGTRGGEIERGLAPAESGIGTLISFSTQPGNVALDGSSRNSPYTGPLVKRIATAGEDVLTTLTAVRNDVLAATSDKQVPWENHALRAKFYFNTAKPETQPGQQTSEAERAWERIKDSKSLSVLKAFRDKYGNLDPVLDALAADHEAELNREQTILSQGPTLSEQTKTSISAFPKSKPKAEKPNETQTALVTPPKVKPNTNDAVCDDALLVAVAIGPKPCIKPGSGQSFRDCPDCPEMVVAPAGSFTMGSPADEPGRESPESPQHVVTIGKPFAVGRFAVTRDEFEAFVKDTGHKAEGGCVIWTGHELKQDSALSWRSPGFAQTGSHPVVCVNWEDTKAYAAWLSKKTGKTYRLLSEAEREYAARAGTVTPFWWGSSITPEQANYDGGHVYEGGGQKGEYRRKTMPVKSFQPNKWGLYQVHGNVNEWTEDCWNSSYDNAPSDGSTNLAGNCNGGVLRGGSSRSFPRDLRAAYREGLRSHRSNVIGFRVARTLTP